ncbi:hypothetical protein MCUN1_003701 [Malassezia cuniculi]|uniref:Alpha/beta hydrolase fold-3 domain-containing protein n=1 Tax=Malassezia cuniculi TaxID=948313 RepID=A0AAF0JDD1_9BASI|nr:hypothetical protein MCUN1_003701 [Malassezia cuniculi]
MLDKSSTPSNESVGESDTHQYTAEVEQTETGHAKNNIIDVSSLIPTSVKRAYAWTERKRQQLTPPSLPIVDFPLQGSGIKSEFNQHPPIWSYQPFKLIYMIYFFTFILFVYMPIRAFTNIPRSGRGRPEWSWYKSMAVTFLRRMMWFMCQTRVVLTPRPPIHKAPRVKNSVFTWVDPIDPDGPESLVRGELRRALNLQDSVIQRTCGYWYSNPKDGSPIGDARAAAGEKVLYHLHGGAYWLGSANESSPVGIFAKTILSKLSEYDSATRAFCLESRLAEHGKPEKGSYPGALLDALAGYIYLVEKLGFTPENITLMGDSSGGNLALALCRYLRDELPHLMPHQLLLFSPWCDVSRSHSGPITAPNQFSTTVLNTRSDMIDSSILYRNTAVCAFLGKLPASETYSNPYISPVSLHLDAEHGGQYPMWGFEGFPARTYIVTGGAELNYEQHVTLAHRMAEGTTHRRPFYVGDMLSATDDYHEYASRCRFPRSSQAAAHYIQCHHTEDIREVELDSREVVLDEERDGVHIFPLFTFCEPERTRSLDRITLWIAGMQL